MKPGNDKRKIFSQRIFGATQNEAASNNARFSESPDFNRISTFIRSFSDIRGRDVYGMSSLPTITDTQPLRIFVATWNVGGKAPCSGLDLNDFLPADDQSDIYVLGFQEIVPLNAGNVLVVEDDEPAAKWLSLINRALNGLLNFDDGAYLPSNHEPSPALCTGMPAPVMKELNLPGSLLSFLKSSSLKAASRSFKTVQGKQLKSCKCPSESVNRYPKDSCFFWYPQAAYSDESSDDDEEDDKGSSCFGSVSGIADTAISPAATTKQRFSLIACKQMVGIFVSIWVRSELVQHVGHLRISCVCRGILGYLGNKGCIAVSMSLYRTSFCFVCSHLSSGEKEGDELRRNSDVVEILKNTQFPRICRKPIRKIPEKILEHDRVIWFGDLNYRIALSFYETKILLQNNDWDTLFEKDQLNMEREAGRVFKGWNEGKIYFAPTYKYTRNSDVYAGDSVDTKNKKQRTPAWCDRILWRGDGIAQLSYIRGESTFSDHRPVISVFVVEVQTLKGALTCHKNTKVVA